MKSLNDNAAFLLSAGDQVNTASYEDEYREFIERESFDGLPLASVIGNHDSKSSAYKDHFNLPNETIFGHTNAGGDYYFVYNNTLFVSINSNNPSVAEHEAAIEEALQSTEGMDIKWKVLTFHHSIYSVASHAEDTDILKRKETYSPIISKHNFDVVLMGHDHVYVRSHLMNGTTPIVKYNDDGSVPSVYENPEGVLYLTANSGSGSKFYKIMNKDFEYSAVQNQERVPNFTNIEVTDNSFKATTYRSTDMSVVDEVELIKKNSTPVDPTKPVKPGDPQPEEEEKESNNSKEDNTYFGFSTFASSKSSKVEEKKELTKSEFIPLTDISGHWAEDLIISTKGYNLHNNSDKFLPDKPITRAEFTVAMVSGLNLEKTDKEIKSFSDVENNAWYREYIDIALQNNLIQGKGNDKFNPQDLITREEAMEIIKNYFNLKNKGDSPSEKAEKILNSFEDSKDVSAWAIDSVKFSLENNLIMGRSTTRLAPLENITRAETVVLINRISKL